MKATPLAQRTVGTSDGVERAPGTEEQAPSPVSEEARTGLPEQRAAWEDWTSLATADPAFWLKSPG
jgi:hypothetical protein